MSGFIWRHAEDADYRPVISVVDDWWGGRHMEPLLPRLFFTHFRPTSFVVEKEGRIVGFLVGFVSQTRPEEAYIHFAGVDPAFRGRGLARGLYERFFEAAGGRGCRTVHCITSIVNRQSVAFHLRMGFVMEPGSKVVDGIPVHSDYHGIGKEHVLFTRALDGEVPRGENGLSHPG